MLDALRAAGLALGVLSDCSSELVEAWTTTPYAERVDAAVFSWETGVRKPDGRMFAEVADRLGVEPCASWYVGDGGSREMWGAERAGMTPILVHNTAYAATHLRVDANNHVPPYAVDDLTDVPGVILGG